MFIQEFLLSGNVDFFHLGDVDHSFENLQKFVSVFEGVVPCRW